MPNQKKSNATFLFIFKQCATMLCGRHILHLKTILNTKPFPVAAAVWHFFFKCSRVMRSKVFSSKKEILEEVNKVDKRKREKHKNFLLTLSHARIYESWDDRDQTSLKWDKNIEENQVGKKVGLTSRQKKLLAPK